MRRAAAEADAAMKRGLLILASIASTAPFLGLFGTCIRIVAAFKGCGGEKWTCLAAVVEGIAESIIPAALGLLVAIPAWCGYRYFRNRVEAFEVEMKNDATELLSCLMPNRSSVR